MAMRMGGVFAAAKAYVDKMLGNALRMDVIQGFTGAQRNVLFYNIMGGSAYDVVADSGTIVFDLGNGYVHKYVTLGGNRTIGAPVSPRQGGVYYINICQDGAGQRLLAWDSSFDWGTAGPPVLTTTAGKCDIVCLVCRDAAAPRFQGFLVGKGFVP